MSRRVLAQVVVQSKRLRSHLQAQVKAVKKDKKNSKLACKKMKTQKMKQLRLVSLLLPKILQLKTLMKRSYPQEEFLSLQKKKQEKKHNHHRLMGSN